MSATATVKTDTRKSELQKRVNELDSALVQHQKKAFEAQSQWRTEQADLERQRNSALAALAEL